LNYLILIKKDNQIKKGNSYNGSRWNQLNLTKNRFISKIRS
jgi:hypothetical protein